MLMSATGQQDVLELFVNKVRVKGIHKNHQFDIFLRDISAILFVHATGVIPGSIEFFFSGAGLLEHKFNHITFSTEQQPQFDKIREAIENMIIEGD